jgi:hypothetical protein
MQPVSASARRLTAWPPYARSRTIGDPGRPILWRSWQGEPARPVRGPLDGRGDPAAHAAAVERYREWITSPEQAELLADARRGLRGLDLDCYCPIRLPCHADVLLELVNRD